MNRRSAQNQNDKRWLMLDRQSIGASREEAALKRFKDFMKKSEGELSFAGHGGRASGLQSSGPKRKR